MKVVQWARVVKSWNNRGSQKKQQPISVVTAVRCGDDHCPIFYAWAISQSTTRNRGDIMSAFADFTPKANFDYRPESVIGSAACRSKIGQKIRFFVLLLTPEHITPKLYSSGSVTYQGELWHLRAKIIRPISIAIHAVETYCYRPTVSFTRASQTSTP